VGGGGEGRGTETRDFYACLILSSWCKALRTLSRISFLLVLNPPQRKFPIFSKIEISMDQYRLPKWKTIKYTEEGENTSTNGWTGCLAGWLRASFTQSFGGEGTLSTISLIGTGRFIIKVTCNILHFFKFHIW